MEITSSNLKTRNESKPEPNLEKTRKTHRAYFTTSDVATIAVFAALQFILQYFAGNITFLPGAERPIVAFPVSFMATITFLRTRKIGAVGLTTLITGIIQVTVSGFPPVIFEWVGATIGAEAVIIAAFVIRKKVKTWSLCSSGAFLMLGRGVGVAIGLLIFLPIAVTSNFTTQALALTYIAFNGVIPFVMALIGAYAAIKLALSMGLVPKDALK